MTWLREMRIDRIYDNTGAPDTDATSGTTAGAFPGTTSILIHLWD